MSSRRSAFLTSTVSPTGSRLLRFYCGGGAARTPELDDVRRVRRAMLREVRALPLDSSVRRWIWAQAEELREVPAPASRPAAEPVVSPVEAGALRRIGEAVRREADAGTGGVDWGAASRVLLDAAA